MSKRAQEDADVPSTSSSSSSSSTSWQNIQMSQSPRAYRDATIESGQSSSGGGGKQRATTASRPSAYPSGQRTSSSSITNTSGSSAGLHNETSASSSSNSSSSTTTQSKSSRARVSMACVHCRQRKIRCDGAQPYCSTCFRLGRACVYEGISEMENILARERKKRSKEAKQARLTSLAGLGIPIPQSAKSLSRDHGRVRSYPSTMGGPSGSRTASGSQQSHGSITPGVIRDSRLARQERLRPYAMPHASQPQPAYGHAGTHDHSQYSKQGQQHPADAPSDPSMHGQQSDSPLPSRRRGVTMDSYPSLSPQLRYDADYEGNLPSGGGPTLAVTSLSQPTTPEATYSMHVSMLSRDLSHQSHSPAEIISEAPSRTSTAGPHEYSLPIGAPSTVFMPDALSALPSSYDYTLSSSGIPSAMPSLRSSVADSTLANSFTSTAAAMGAPSSSSSTTMPRLATSQTDLEQQLAMRRRSSFDVGHFWRRTSVADAAVANFFDRVVQARGPRKDDDVAGQILTTSPHRSHAYPMAFGERPNYGMSPYPSSSTGPGRSLPTQVEADEYQQEIADSFYPTYGNLQQVMQESGQLDTPYTALTSDPTPLTFQHPFVVATAGAGSRDIGNQSGRFDRASEEYYEQATSSGLPSPAYPPTMYQTHATSAGMAPTLSSSSSASLPLRGDHPEYRQYQEPQTSGSMSMVASSFSTGARSFQRAAPPQQLNFGDLPSFGSPRQSMMLSYTGESSSTYGSAQSTLSPHQRMLSSSSGSNIGGAYGASSSSSGGPGNNNMGNVTYFTGSSSHGSMPPVLPTPMSELSSHMFAMAPPSTNLAMSPTTATSPRIGSATHSEGGANEHEGQYETTPQHWPRDDRANY